MYGRWNKKVSFTQLTSIIIAFVYTSDKEGTFVCKYFYKYFYKRKNAKYLQIHLTLLLFYIKKRRYIKIVLNIDIPV